MIHLILWALGLTWVLGHWAFWLAHMIGACGAVYLLWEKGYVTDARGVVLAIVSAIEWSTGILVAALLHARPAPPPPTPIYAPPYYP